MGAIRNLEGKRFGRLLVLAFAGLNNKKLSLWFCACDCGTFNVHVGASLSSGNTKSCGCICREMLGDRRRTHGRSSVGDELYAIWCTMKNRCYCTTSKHYANYGGRGIEICDRWLESFANFLADMGERPAGMQIERKDNNGNYEPTNCVWATITEQGRNKRNNVLITIDGEEKCLSAWCEERQMAYSVVWRRIRKLKWSPEKALTRPITGSRHQSSAANSNISVAQIPT